MIQVRITKPNAFMATKDGDRRLKVGEKLELNTDEVPNFLVGKCVVLGDDADKELEAATGETYEVGEETYTLDELKALYEEITGNKPGNKKPETLVKELTTEE